MTTEAHLSPRPQTPAAISTFSRWLNAATCVMRLQLRMSLRRLEDVLPLFAVPLGTVVSMAVVCHLNRPNLMALPLTAGILMSVGQMAFFVGAEAVEGDRMDGRFDAFIGVPMPYSVQLFLRVWILSLVGLLGAAETWMIARFAFATSVPIAHPVLLTATIFTTSIAAAGTGVLLSAFFSMGKTARTFQNAVSAPLYLLGGVFVPTSFLPAGLQVMSKSIFLFWAAKLVRASLGYGQIGNWWISLAAICALGVAAFLAGHVVTVRMSQRLAVTGEANLT
jgi:ABC-2 type transport system permease protein